MRYLSMPSTDRFNQSPPPIDSMTFLPPPDH